MTENTGGYQAGENSIISRCFPKCPPGSDVTCPANHCVLYNFFRNEADGFYCVLGELRAVQRAGLGGVCVVPRTLPREGVQGTNTPARQAA